MSAAPSIVPSLAGRTVLFRADLSAGIGPAIGGAIADLTAAGARVAVVSGFGDPVGDKNPALSLKPFVAPLAPATGRRVTFVADCVGAVAEAGLDAVPFGEVALLENVRFHPEARRDSRHFAMRLSVLGDFFTVGGALPDRPIGWIRALAELLPAPPLPTRDPSEKTLED